MTTKASIRKAEMDTLLVRFSGETDRIQAEINRLEAVRGGLDYTYWFAYRAKGTKDFTIIKTYEEFRKRFSGQFNEE